MAKSQSRTVRLRKERGGWAYYDADGTPKYFAVRDQKRDHYGSDAQTVVWMLDEVTVQEDATCPICHKEHATRLLVIPTGLDVAVGHWCPDCEAMISTVLPR